ncbi:type II toxin-antitoxin system RelE/ParE family toxin [Luteimonas sp. A478]
MTVQVAILHGAEADLHELRRYLLRRFGASRWRDSKQEITRALARIASQPQAGKLPDELLALNLVQYRQVLSGMNRIIYELRGDVAYVHVICDVRRDLRAVLLRRILETTAG